MTLEEMLDKKWGVDVFEKDVIAAHEETKEIYAISLKSLINPEFVIGRTRVWLDDNLLIKLIVHEQKDGKVLRVENIPPPTEPFRRYPRLHNYQSVF